MFAQHYRKYQQSTPNYLNSYTQKIITKEVK